MTSHAVVVGAGPVGALSALLFVKHQVSVTLIERHAAPRTQSRASSFHPSTLDLLKPLGIQLDAHPNAVKVPAIQWRNGRGELKTQFDYDRIRDLTQHPFRIHLEQQSLLDDLANLIAQEPDIETLYGTTVTDLDLAKLGVMALSPEGRKHGVQGDIVVGCDGAHSTIRRLAGIPFPVTEYPTHALRAEVKGDLSDRLKDKTLGPLSGVCYFRDQEDGVSLIKMHDVTRLIVRAKNGQPDIQRFAEALLHATPWNYETLAIDNIETYRLRRGVVADYLCPQAKVIVLGDAAHQTSTAGGLNMNSGIHDAFALIPVLAQWIKGRGDRARVEDIAQQRRRYLLDHVIPRSERRVQGLQDPIERSVKESLMDLRQIGSDPFAIRQYLIEASLLDAPFPVLEDDPLTLI